MYLCLELITIGGKSINVESLNSLNYAKTLRLSHSPNLGVLHQGKCTSKLHTLLLLSSDLNFWTYINTLYIQQLILGNCSLQIGSSSFENEFPNLIQLSVYFNSLECLSLSKNSSLVICTETWHEKIPSIIGNFPNASLNIWLIKYCAYLDSRRLIHLLSPQLPVCIIGLHCFHMCWINKIYFDEYKPGKIHYTTGRTNGVKT